jgi:mannosyltransferase
MDAVIVISKLVNTHGVQVNYYLPAKNKQQAWADLSFGGMVLVF